MIYDNENWPQTGHAGPQPDQQDCSTAPASGPGRQAAGEAPEEAASHVGWLLGGLMLHLAACGHGPGRDVNFKAG